MRILIMTDSLHMPTGQGKVGRELALGLQKHGHDIGYIGLFHNTSIPPSQPAGIRCWFTNNANHGSDVLDAAVSSFQPDILLTIGDFWNLAYIADPGVCRTRRLFQWCSYIPVDGEPLNGGIPPALIPVIEDIDIPVAYTNYAKEAVLKSCFDQETRNRIKVIYHGVDTDIYKPADPTKRREIRDKFGIDDKFIFLTVSRNQSRKNIPELLRAWKIFSELPEVQGKVLLWPHMYFQDPMGWDIDDLLDILKLRNQSIMYFDQVAHTTSEMLLIQEKQLAELYQISDAFVLLAGEGFGLPTIEAMATALPCVLMNHSASAELGAEGRAALVDPVGFMTWTGRHLTDRPVPDLDKTVAAFLKVYREHAYRRTMAKAGYEFAKKHTWKAAVDEWNGVFLKHEIPFVKPIEMEVVS